MIGPEVAYQFQPPKGLARAATRPPEEHAGGFEEAKEDLVSPGALGYMGRNGFSDPEVDAG